MYDKAVENYNTDPSLPERKRHEKQENKLSLQSTVQSYLFSFYRSNNPNITHFYNNMSYSGVPVWALFEVLNMGDFGKLLSCLTYDVRDAIAHNDVIFDSRFKKSNPSPAMKMCIIQEIGLPHINFDTIDDYIILVSYYLNLLEVQNTEIIAFIQSAE